MQYLPPALEALTEQFAKLPGIGTKTAQRLAFYIRTGRRKPSPMPSATPKAPSPAVLSVRT